MFKVDGIPIYLDELEVLERIKETVLDEQGREILRKIKRSGDNIMVCCPKHSGGQERKPSCGILTVDKKGHSAGEVHCFSCDLVGSFDVFVSACFGFFDDEGAYGRKWLRETFISGEEYERPDVPITCQRVNPFQMLKNQKTTNFVSEQELASYRFYHPYMWKRKLTPEVVEKYDVGYQKDYRLQIKKEDGTIEYSNPIECLTFPCRDINGNCLFVSRRAIYNKSFFLPLDLEKPVYGIYELPKNAESVVICESVINALTCASYGIPAVALFGTGDSLQYKQLNSLPIKHYILGLDPDKAGAKGTYKLKNNLKGKLLTKLILPYKKDINDLTYEQFMSLPEVMV